MHMRGTRREKEVEICATNLANKTNCMNTATFHIHLYVNFKIHSNFYWMKCLIHRVIVTELIFKEKLILVGTSASITEVSSEPSERRATTDSH
jgi:hypothetical protein